MILKNSKNKLYIKKLKILNNFYEKNMMTSYLLFNTNKIEKLFVQSTTLRNPILSKNQWVYLNRLIGVANDYFTSLKLECPI